MADEFGNYWDDQLQRWISPEGNTFDPYENVWRDPRQGTVYVGEQWQDATNWQPTPQYQNQTIPRATASAGTNYGAASQTYDPGGQQLSNRTNVLDAQRNALAQQLQTYQAGAAIIPLQRANIAADETYLNQQSRHTRAEEAYIREQQRASEARLADERSIQSARRDVEGIDAALREQFERNTMAYRDPMAGIPHPIDVPLPEDTEANFGPGVRAQIRTPEEYATENAQEAEAIRRIVLEQARLAVSLIGIDVERARIEAAKVGLTLQEAQLVVDQAQREERLANMNVQRAQIDANYGELPPFAGAKEWVDPYTGRSEWVTPYEADLRQKQYSQQFSESGAGAREKAEFEVFSPAALIDMLVDNQNVDQAWAALRAKGWSDYAINTAIERARFQAASTSSRGTTSSGGYTINRLGGAGALSQGYGPAAPWELPGNIPIYKPPSSTSTGGGGSALDDLFGP